MREARIRVRSIKLKDGGAEIRVIHGPTWDDDRRFVEKKISQCLDHECGPRVSGFAFVVWGPDNASVAYSFADQSSKIPRIMVPDFARERLMADVIESWAKR